MNKWRVLLVNLFWTSSLSCLDSFLFFPVFVIEQWVKMQPSVKSFVLVLWFNQIQEVLIWIILKINMFFLNILRWIGVIIRFFRLHYFINHLLLYVLMYLSQILPVFLDVVHLLASARFHIRIDIWVFWDLLAEWWSPTCPAMRLDIVVHSTKGTLHFLFHWSLLLVFLDLLRLHGGITRLLFMQFFNHEPLLIGILFLYLFYHFL